MTASAAVLFLGLAAAFGYLLTASKPTVDTVIIVTTPSGALVTFDGRPVGPSPIRLDNVRIGPHSVQAVKDGFLPAGREIEISADFDEPVDIELKPVAPAGSAAQTTAQRIKEFTALAEDAYRRGEYVLPPVGSAFYYTDALLALDRRNMYANEMRARIREKLLASARKALAGRDLDGAHVLFSQVKLAFPNDPDAAQGLVAVEEQRRPN